MAILFMSARLWLLVTLFILGSKALYCPPTPDSVGANCPSEETCDYGTTLDRCRKTVCAKGPGDSCGIGMFEVFGKCGEVMFCRCGLCLGCSIHRVIKCSNRTCT